MAQIDLLYFAMLTDSTDDAGTDSPVNLTINEGGVDILNHRFGDTVQQDQEEGQANLYRLDVRSQRIESNRLGDGSIRVGLLGDDEWRPDTLFLWGTAHGRRPIEPPAIVPLAIETGVAAALSTDDAGAVPSIPVRLVRTGSPTMMINRLLLIVTTAYDADSGSWWDPSSWGSASIGDPGATGDSGTDDQIALEIVAGGQLVVQSVIPDTSQDDLESGQANLYTVPVAVPFTRASMASDAVRLSIRGTDQWLPSAVYLFGLNNRQGRPDSIIPLVRIDNWGIVPLSTDTAEGTPQAVLPLVPLGPTIWPEDSPERRD
jgi:hypothetical protein